MPKFEPFKNDHQSMQIGELIFENQTDKIIVYGDIDIKKTAEGLEQALKLQQLFNEVVDKLQAAKAEISLENKVEDKGITNENTGNKEVENPFL